MNMTNRAKVVKIGNSRGIRIPRTLLEQASLTDEVEMSVDGVGWATTSRICAKVLVNSCGLICCA